MLFSMFSCLLFCLMLSTMLVLNSANSILLMSGFVVHDVVFHMFDVNFLLNRSSFAMLSLLAFCSGFTILMMSLSFSLSLFHSLVVRLLFCNSLLPVFLL